MKRKKMKPAQPVGADKDKWPVNTTRNPKGFSTGGYIKNSVTGLTISGLVTNNQVYQWLTAGNSYNLSIASSATIDSREKQFESAGFAAGSVRGTRSFIVDSLGRLTGINYPQVWTPGENHAECRSTTRFVRTPRYEELNRQRDDVYQKYAYASYSDVIVIPKMRLADYKWTPDDYLYPHTGVETEEVNAREYFEAEYRRISDEMAAERDANRLSDEHGLDECEHGFYAYYEGSNDYYKPGYVSAVIEGYGEAILGTRGFKCMKARILALYVPSEANNGYLVRRNYGGVPVFDSFEKMVAEYPCDDGGINPSPENDPDFWTREA